MRGGAFFNGKEGRDDFRANTFLMVKKDGMILEKPPLMVKKDGMILEQRKIKNTISL